MADLPKIRHMKCADDFQPGFERDTEVELYSPYETRVKQSKVDASSSRTQTMSGMGHGQDIELEQDPDVAMGARDIQSDVAVNVGFCPNGQPPQDGRVPATTASRRFQGCCLELIGTFYPDADLAIHRIGDPEVNDFSIKGRNLTFLRSLTRDHKAIYRVTLSECDAPNQSCVGWSRGALGGRGFTADDFCNLLELGSDQVGKMMMITVKKDGVVAWNVARQIPGKKYTLQECLDLLAVPDDKRRELQTFGNKTWTNGESVPELWICSDLSLRNVANKIRNLMRQ